MTTRQKRRRQKQLRHRRAKDPMVQLLDSVEEQGFETEEVPGPMTPWIAGFFRKAFRRVARVW